LIFVNIESDFCQYSGKEKDDFLVIFLGMNKGS